MAEQIYIDIKPEVNNNMFAARILMSNYELGTNGPLTIALTARRNDGQYEDKTIIYPEEATDFDGKPLDGYDYDGNVIVYFFGMYKTAVAQIVRAVVNGEEVRIKYTQVKDKENVYVRYDDSPVHTHEFINYNDIRLDFEVEDTHNPKTLRVVDQSEWGILEGRTSIIEISVPGKEKPAVLFYGKNQVNVFTSMTLGINCEVDKPEFLDLPDGIYDITVKGSPDKYQANRKYLKSDTARLKLDKMWVRASFLCPEQDDELLDKIREAEYVLGAAEANTRLGNICEAHRLMEYLQELLEGMVGCSECGDRAGRYDIHKRKKID